MGVRHAVGTYHGCALCSWDTPWVCVMQLGHTMGVRYVVGTQHGCASEKLRHHGCASCSWYTPWVCVSEVTTQWLCVIELGHTMGVSHAVGTYHGCN